MSYFNFLHVQVILLIASNISLIKIHLTNNDLLLDWQERRNPVTSRGPQFQKLLRQKAGPQESHCPNDPWQGSFATVPGRHQVSLISGS